MKAHSGLHCSFLAQPPPHRHTGPHLQRREEARLDERGLGVAQARGAVAGHAEVRVLVDGAGDEAPAPQREGGVSAQWAAEVRVWVGGVYVCVHMGGVGDYIKPSVQRRAHEAARRKMCGLQPAHRTSLRSPNMWGKESGKAGAACRGVLGMGGWLGDNGTQRLAGCALYAC
jgi:hypothetical protein